LPHHKYDENNKRKIERMDLTMVRRSKSNYGTYINKVSSVIVLQDEKVSKVTSCILSRLTHSSLIPCPQWRDMKVRVMSKKTLL